MIKEDNPVLRRVQGMTRCSQEQKHRRLQPVQEHSDLAVAESLDPADRVNYTSCGLCGGLVEITQPVLA